MCIPLVASRDATATTVTLLDSAAGFNTALGAIRDVPRIPSRNALDSLVTDVEFPMVGNELCCDVALEMIEQESRCRLCLKNVSWNSKTDLTSLTNLNEQSGV